MSEEQQLDIIQTTDENGQELFLLVEQYFYYNGEEYVLLRPVADDKGSPISGEAQQRVMRVLVTEEPDGEATEDFLPLEAALEESLLRSASIRYTLPEDAQQPDE